MRIFITFIKFIILIIKFIAVFSSSMFLKFIKMKIIRKHFEYEIIQKIFDDYKNLIISEFHNLSFDFLMRIFVIFIFFANHINKFNIFEFIIYA